MKIKNGFILKKLGTEYMAIAIGEANKDFHGLIRMNKAGAWLWKQLAEGISEEALVENMCSYYEDLDRETAQADLEEFLETIKVALEV